MPNLVQWDRSVVEDDPAPSTNGSTVGVVQQASEFLRGGRELKEDPINEAVKLLRVAGEQLPNEYRAACYLDVMYGDMSIDPTIRLRFLTEVLYSRSGSAYEKLTWQNSPKQRVDRLKLKRKIRHAFDEALKNDIGELLALDPKNLGSANGEWNRWFEDPHMGGHDVIVYSGEFRAVDISKPFRYWLSQVSGITKARLRLAVANFAGEKNELALREVDQIVKRLPGGEPHDLEIGKLRVGARIAQRMKDIEKEFEYRRQLLFLEFANDPTLMSLGEAMYLGELAAECGDVEVALQVRYRIGMPDRSDLAARAVAVESLAMQRSGDEMTDSIIRRKTSLEKYEAAAQLAQTEMDKVFQKIAAYVASLREYCQRYFSGGSRDVFDSLTANIRTAYSNAGLYDPTHEIFDSNDIARRVRPKLGPLDRDYLFGSRSAHELEKSEVYEAVVRESLEPYRSLVDATTMGWIRLGLARRSLGVGEAGDAFQKAELVAPFASDRVRRTLHFARDYVPAPDGPTQTSGQAIGSIVRELDR